MKVEAIEYDWIAPEMRELYEKLGQLRDEVWQQCRIELGEDDLPPEGTATELAARRRYENNPKRRAEIIESYRESAQPYVDKMADLFGKHTKPKMIVSQST